MFNIKTIVWFYPQGVNTGCADGAHATGTVAGRVQRGRVATRIAAIWQCTYDAAMSHAHMVHIQYRSSAYKQSRFTL